MHAKLADGSLSIDSEPLKVELTCDAPIIADSDERRERRWGACRELRMGVPATGTLPSGPRSSCACRTTFGPLDEHWLPLTCAALVGACLRRLKRRAEPKASLKGLLLPTGAPSSPR